MKVRHGNQTGWCSDGAVKITIIILSRQRGLADNRAQLVRHSREFPAKTLHHSFGKGSERLIGGEVSPCRSTLKPPRRKANFTVLNLGVLEHTRNLVFQTLVKVRVYPFYARKELI